MFRMKTAEMIFGSASRAALLLFVLTLGVGASRKVEMSLILCPQLIWKQENQLKNPFLEIKLSKMSRYVL